jgi:hypothetical protein
MSATRDQPGDRDQARRFLDAALDTATDLSLATIERQARSLRAAIDEPS